MTKRSIWMETNSEALVQSACQGDPVAVERLLAMHLPRLQAYIRLRTHPTLRARESASDLVQSTCREILEHVDRYQYQGEANFRYWLYTTAKRKIANRAEYYQAAKRAAKREIPLDAQGGQDALLADCYSRIATPSQHAMASELRGRMEDAFGKLRDEQREVILLAKVVGLSRAEIAKRIGRSEGAVRMLLSRSLARLSEILDEEL